MKPHLCIGALPFLPILRLGCANKLKSMHFIRNCSDFTFLSADLYNKTADLNTPKDEQ